MEILPFFTKNVGPYAYKKLANVQSKTTFGGLENANTIFYSEGSVSGNRRSEALIAHEIAHQWFGNMATEKTFAHLWLSEGFATYMTILYLENKYGVDTAIHMLKQDRREVIAHAKTSNRPVVDTTHDYMELLNANSYQKGGWILHMLRNELGDSVFWQGIRKYYSTYAGSTADTDDLRKILENVSGKNLELFFRQWLFTPGVPQLDIQWSYARNKVDIFFRQLQPLPFDLKIDINIITGSGTTKKTIALNTKDKMFTFDLPVTPTRIEIDPQVKLLADWKIVEKKYGVGTSGQ
jgi:aminopeptidase N